MTDPAGSESPGFGLGASGPDDPVGAGHDPSGHDPSGLDPSGPQASGNPPDQGGRPATFHFRSRWRLGCPREQVWDALVDFHQWPVWWPGLEKVIETIHGDPGGIGQQATSVWRGPIGYSLTITIEAVERVHPEFLCGVASGDVVGEGSWRLTPVPGSGAENTWTGVEFDWNVRTNRRWMEFLTPIARPIFVSGHDRVMERGAIGLAEHLGCDLWDFFARAR